MTAALGAMPVWFNLHRHDGEGATPPVDTAPPADPEDPQAEAILADAVEALGDAGKKALNAERDARKAAEKERAALAARLKAFEDAQKTEAEKLAERADVAEKREQAATARAVKAEVKALADGFADREDAVLNLGDLGKFITDGEVDTEAISDALGKVLERKPHLAAAKAPRTPAPDPSQGRGGDNQPTDYRTAEKTAFESELAKFGLRPRS